MESYHPTSIPTATEDPYKTLFVARINYDTPEDKIKREFEEFGAIKSVSLRALARAARKTPLREPTPYWLVPRPFRCTGRRAGKLSKRTLRCCV